MAEQPHDGHVRDDRGDEGAEVVGNPGRHALYVAGESRGVCRPAGNRTVHLEEAECVRKEEKEGRGKERGALGHKVAKGPDWVLDECERQDAGGGVVCQLQGEERPDANQGYAASPCLLHDGEDGREPVAYENRTRAKRDR